MGKVRFAEPIQDLRGKINTPKEHNGAIWVFRQKCYGVNGRGKPLLGPKEHYAMHRHEGKWSEKATNNRKSFGDLCAQAYDELKDPERKAYWEAEFAEQKAHPVRGKKVYKRLASFVVARLKEATVSEVSTSQSVSETYNA